MEKDFGLVMVAGGQGTRMGGDLPKPFIKLAGREILLHSLDAFAGIEWIGERVLVLPKAMIRELFGPVKQRNFPSESASNPFVRELAKLGVTECVCGGERRQDSVLQGLRALSDASNFVMIHDGVRPFVQSHDIEALAAEIRAGKAATLSTPVTDSLRFNNSNLPIDRESLVAVQTPQGGASKLLREALESMSEQTLSDDLSAFAAIGAPLALVNGAKSNIKLTTPEDLEYAAYLMRGKEQRGNA